MSKNGVLEGFSGFWGGVAKRSFFFQNCVPPVILGAVLRPQQVTTPSPPWGKACRRFHVEEEGKGVKDGEPFKATPEAVEQFQASLARLGLWPPGPACFVLLCSREWWLPEQFQPQPLVTPH